MRSLPQIDYRDYRTTALRSLVHCVDRNEDRGITDRRRSDTTVASGGGIICTAPPNSLSAPIVESVSVAVFRTLPQTNSSMP